MHVVMSNLPSMHRKLGTTAIAAPGKVDYMYQWGLVRAPTRTTQYTLPEDSPRGALVDLVAL